MSEQFSEWRPAAALQPRAGTEGDNAESSLDAAGASIDPQVLIAAFSENLHGMHVLARRLCGDDAAADVTQEVFLRVWRNPRTFDPARGTIRQYLLTITRGVAIDQVRKRSSQRTNDLRQRHFEPDRQREGIERLVDLENNARVVAAVDALPVGEREAITAAFFLHLTYRDVAAGLGIAEGTAKSRIRSGLARLREELRDVHTSSLD